jgi:Rod binding domain-containing protein
VSFVSDAGQLTQRESISIRPLNAPPLLTKASAVPNSPKLMRLKQAAGEFEGLLLSNLWKSMKSAFASPDDDSDDPAHETLDDMGVQAMSNAVGKAGGLGLGKLIVNHLAPLIANSANSQNGNGSRTGGKALQGGADSTGEGRSDRRAD